MSKVSAPQVHISRIIKKNNKISDDFPSCNNIINFSQSEKKFNSTNGPEYNSETIVLIDFLNLARKHISERPEAKFRTVEEFIDNISTIACQIKKMGNFKQIYLVTKSFKFNKDISYNDVLKIIMWSFCKTIPEWIDRIHLVLVNGINDQDKEADDRALFILYNEFSKTIESPIIIFSNDNFESLKTHFLRYVVLNFYYIKHIAKNWKESEIISHYKAHFQQDKKITKSQYVIIHPINNETNFISIIV